MEIKENKEREHTWEESKYYILLIVAFFILCFAIGEIINTHRENKINADPMCVTGDFLNYETAAEGASSIRYDFYIGNRRYIGEGGNDYDYPDFVKGDKIVIKYSASNPNYSIALYKCFDTVKYRYPTKCSCSE